MCMIVDANKLGELFATPPHEDAEPIRRWLDRPKGAGSLVYSYSADGKFANELGGNAKRKLADYVQAGRARLVPACRFAEKEAELKAGGKLRSDDAHVLALAMASGVRLLYTADKALIADFKDRRFVRMPRGKIYSRAANADLLTSSACGG